MKIKTWGSRNGLGAKPAFFILTLCLGFQVYGEAYAQERKQKPLQGQIYQRDLQFNTAVEACAFIAQPSDLLLIHSDEIFAANDLGTSTSILNGIKALLSISDPFVSFSHAEFITEIRKDSDQSPTPLHQDVKEATDAAKERRRERERLVRQDLPDVEYNPEEALLRGPVFHSYSDLVTISFYPEKAAQKSLNFEVHGKEESDYRSHFTVYRVKGDFKRKEDALDRAHNYKNYGRAGVCGDFVNWCYSDFITNRFFSLLWIVGDLLHVVYPPAAFDSPDDLAESLWTKKICEVTDDQLTYPERVDTRDFLAELSPATASRQPVMRNHALRVKKELRQKGFISSEGKVQIEEILISHKTDAALEAESEWQQKLRALQKKKQEETLDENGEWVIEEKEQPKYRDQEVKSNELP